MQPSRKPWLFIAPGVVTSCSWMKLCSFFFGWDLDKSRIGIVALRTISAYLEVASTPFFGSLHMAGSLSRRLLISTTLQLSVCRFKQPPNFIPVLLRVGNLWNFLHVCSNGRSTCQTLCFNSKIQPSFFTNNKPLHLFSYQKFKKI